MKEVRILAPTGMMGYNIDQAAFDAGMAMKPHAIVADAGSTDAGPQKLGAGVGVVSKMATMQDLDVMLTAGLANQIPIIIGSAGGSGGRPHIKWTMEAVEELAQKKGWKLRVAVINATADKAWLKEKLAAGDIISMTGVPELTDTEIDLATEIVAQMGHEPYLEALSKGVDLIIAGRSYDPSMAVAACIHNGIENLGLAYHMGKIIECGTLWTIPGGNGPIMGIINDNSFAIQSLFPDKKATPLSVAAHTLYEKSHPFLLPGPGGMLNLELSSFEQLDNNAVRIRGSRFIPDKIYRVKLEGSKLAGYRTIFIGAVRDPIAVSAIDDLVGIAHYMADQTASSIGLNKDLYHIDLKVYGKNGVMGDREPIKNISTHELCVVGEIVAPTQEQASAICSKVRAGMMHGPFEGRKSTAGNMAFPFAPSDFAVGATYQFNVYHLVALDDPIAFFTTEYHNIG